MGAPRLKAQQAETTGGTPSAPADAASDAELRIVVRALDEALTIAGETLESVGTTLDGLLDEMRATNARLADGEAAIEARHAAIAALLAERRPTA